MYGIFTYITGTYFMGPCWYTTVPHVRPHQKEGQVPAAMEQRQGQGRQAAPGPQQLLSQAFDLNSDQMKDQFDEDYLLSIGYFLVRMIIKPGFFSRRISFIMFGCQKNLKSIESIGKKTS